MQKKILLNLLAISLIGIVLTTVALYIIQTIIAYNSANETFHVRITEIENRIKENNKQIEELTKTVKEDLISRTRALALMIELDPEIIRDIDKLNEITKSIDVDEIHIIDENGILFGGTNPEYFGMDFASTEQTKPFLAILDDSSLEIAQDPTPNGSVGLMRQYAGVSLRNQKGIAQIGMVPERLEKALVNNTIDNILKHIPVRNSGYYFAIEKETSVISAHPNKQILGMYLGDIPESGTITFDGQKVLYNSKIIDNHIVGVAIPYSEIFNDRTFYTFVFLGLMFVIYSIFCFSVNLYLKRNIVQGILDIICIFEKVSSGDMDVVADIRSNNEFVKLSDGINHMLSSIKMKMDKIAALAYDSERLAAIIAIADAGVIVKDKNGVVMEWNIGAENILGYKPEEMIGKTTHSYAPEDSWEAIDKVDTCLGFGEHISHVDVVRKHKNGQLIDCSASYTPIFNNENFEGSVAIFHDITDKKLAEKKARNLAGIVAMADAGVILKDKNGVVTEWNIGAENILGYKPEEMIGKTTHSYAPEESWEAIDKVDVCLRFGEHISHIDVVRKHKNGQLIDCSASYTPIFNNEKFEGSVAIFHDITDKKLAEKKARNLAGIVAMADAGVIIKDKNGIVTEWNIGAENILGYKPEEIIGKTTHSYAPKECWSEIDKSEIRLIKGEHISHVDVIRKHKDGHLIDCSSSYTPIFNEEGEYEGAVAIFHDITDKKTAEKALMLAYEKIEKQNITILSSIDYASKIQKNLLSKNNVFEKSFSDYSVVWKPRDIVGGDIYWIKSFNEGTILCVCDCTGHGTPGALLTMLVVSALETEVNENNYKDTAEIIWKLEQRLVRVLNVEQDDRIKNKAPEVKDGCDLAVLYIDNDKNVTVSSGNTHVFICDGTKVKNIKGQRIFVGEGSIKRKEDIKTEKIPADSNNKYYIASDGLYDQIGGERHVPFGYNRFKQIILNNHNEKQEVISDKIWKEFENYRGNETRRDDFELITFKP